MQNCVASPMFTTGGNMAGTSTCCYNSITPPVLQGKPKQQQQQASFRRPRVAVSASKSGGFSIKSIISKCESCGGQGAVECQGCKGTGRNKKNGNIFERWKCFDCQGFGMKSCPSCGKGGLTPEQRGER